MSQHPPVRPSTVLRTVRKYAVSAFVVCSFSAYALHERMVGTQETTALSQVPPAVTREVPLPPTLTPAALQAAVPTVIPTPSTLPQIATSQPTAVPTEVPSPTSALVAGRYRDGSYSGSVADAYFGDVQVQAVIRNGQLADVTWMAYPNHRRTSVRINDEAMPYLTNEAIQVQSAKVDIISGATLTSEAFAVSLQAALDAARS